jgi:hypothetical protein
MSPEGCSLRGFLLLLRGRNGDGGLGRERPCRLSRLCPLSRPARPEAGITLRTFEATCESERCDEQRYQGREPHTCKP